MLPLNARLLATLLLSLCAGSVSAQVGVDDIQRDVNEWLVPGSGWTGPTLNQVLLGDHSEAVAIAHWTRAPEQSLWRQDTERFRLGVLGYHRSGVANVRFAVDAGPWVEVARTRRSSQTGHYGYSVVLRPESFVRGWHEVRAVVTPENGASLGGTTRVISWRFYSAIGELPGLDYEERWVDPLTGSDTVGDGTNAAPYRSLRQAIDSVAANPEGAQIFLRSAGSTPIPLGGQTVVIQNERPITIRRAPGGFPIIAPQSTATLDRIQVRNLRFEELKVDLSWIDMFDRGVVAGDAPMVFSNCRLQGFTSPAEVATYDARLAPVGVDERIYLLESRAQDFRGSLEFDWGRALVVLDAKAIVQAQALIDSEVSNTNSGYSPNVAVIGPENGLLDGVFVHGGFSVVGPVGQGAVDGTAIVNSLFDGSIGPQYYETVSVFSNTRRHLLVLHSSFVDAYIQVDGESAFPGGFDLEHGLVYGVVADFVTDDSASGFYNNTSSSPAGLTLDRDTLHTHHARPGWSNWTHESLTGTYVDFAAGDFRVRASSPAAARIPGSQAYVRFDLNGDLRGGLTALGALKGESE
ncbi:MAG: hypothetical protein ACI8QZ_002495 [Chlamydiales bacterium]|jgi:hypothetical protein